MTHCQNALKSLHISTLDFKTLNTVFVSAYVKSFEYNFKSFVSTYLCTCYFKNNFMLNVDIYVF